VNPNYSKKKSQHFTRWRRSSTDFGLNVNDVKVAYTKMYYAQGEQINRNAQGEQINRNREMAEKKNSFNFLEFVFTLFQRINNHKISAK